MALLINSSSQPWDLGLNTSITNTSLKVQDFVTEDASQKSIVWLLFGNLPFSQLHGPGTALLKKFSSTIVSADLDKICTNFLTQIRGIKLPITDNYNPAAVLRLLQYFAAISTIFRIYLNIPNAQTISKFNQLGKVLIVSFLPEAIDLASNKQFIDKAITVSGCVANTCSLCVSLLLDYGQLYYTQQRQLADDYGPPLLLAVTGLIQVSLDSLDKDQLSDHERKYKEKDNDWCSPNPHQCKDILCHPFGPKLLQRLTTMLNEYSTIDFDDESSSVILDRTLAFVRDHRFLTTPDGRKIIATLLTSDITLAKHIHNTIKAYISSVKLPQSVYTECHNPQCDTTLPTIPDHSLSLEKAKWSEITSYGKLYYDAIVLLLGHLPDITPEHRKSMTALIYDFITEILNGCVYIKDAETVTKLHLLVNAAFVPYHGEVASSVTLKRSILGLFRNTLFSAYKVNNTAVRYNCIKLAHIIFPLVLESSTKIKGSKVNVYNTYIDTTDTDSDDDGDDDDGDDDDDDDDDDDINHYHAHDKFHKKPKQLRLNTGTIITSADLVHAQLDMLLQLLYDECIEIRVMAIKAVTRVFSQWWSSFGIASHKRDKILSAVFSVLTRDQADGTVRIHALLCVKSLINQRTGLPEILRFFPTMENCLFDSNETVVVNYLEILSMLVNQHDNVNENIVNQNEFPESRNKQRLQSPLPELYSLEKMILALSTTKSALVSQKITQLLHSIYITFSGGNGSRVERFLPLLRQSPKAAFVLIREAYITPILDCFHQTPQEKGRHNKNSNGTSQNAQTIRINGVTYPLKTHIGNLVVFATTLLHMIILNAKHIVYKQMLSLPQYFTTQDIATLLPHFTTLEFTGNKGDITDTLDDDYERDDDDDGDANDENNSYIKRENTNKPSETKARDDMAILTKIISGVSEPEFSKHKTHPLPTPHPEDVDLYMEQTFLLLLERGPLRRMKFARTLTTNQVCWGLLVVASLFKIFSTSLDPKAEYLQNIALFSSEIDYVAMMLRNLTRFNGYFDHIDVQFVEETNEIGTTAAIAHVTLSRYQFSAAVNFITPPTSTPNRTSLQVGILDPEEDYSLQSVVSSFLYILQYVPPAHCQYTFDTWFPDLLHSQHSHLALKVLYLDHVETEKRRDAQLTVALTHLNRLVDVITTLHAHFIAGTLPMPGDINDENDILAQTEPITTTQKLNERIAQYSEQLDHTLNDALIFLGEKSALHQYVRLVTLSLYTQLINSGIEPETIPFAPSLPEDAEEATMLIAQAEATPEGTITAICNFVLLNKNIQDEMIRFSYGNDGDIGEHRVLTLGSNLRSINSIKSEQNGDGITIADEKLSHEDDIVYIKFHGVSNPLIELQEAFQRAYQTGRVSFLGQDAALLNATLTYLLKLFYHVAYRNCEKMSQLHAFNQKKLKTVLSTVPEHYGVVISLQDTNYTSTIGLLAADNNNPTTKLARIFSSQSPFDSIIKEFVTCTLLMVSRVMQRVWKMSDELESQGKEYFILKEKLATLQRETHKDNRRTPHLQQQLIRLDQRVRNAEDNLRSDSTAFNIYLSTLKALLATVDIYSNTIILSNSCLDMYLHSIINNQPTTSPQNTDDEEIITNQASKFNSKRRGSQQNELPISQNWQEFERAYCTATINHTVNYISLLTDAVMSQVLIPVHIIQPLTAIASTISLNATHLQYALMTSSLSSTYTELVSAVTQSYSTMLLPHLLRAASSLQTYLYHGRLSDIDISRDYSHLFSIKEETLLLPSNTSTPQCKAAASALPTEQLAISTIQPPEPRQFRVINSLTYYKYTPPLAEIETTTLLEITPRSLDNILKQFQCTIPHTEQQVIFLFNSFMSLIFSTLYLSTLPPSASQRSSAALSTTTAPVSSLLLNNPHYKQAITHIFKQFLAKESIPIIQFAIHRILNILFTTSLLQYAATQCYAVEKNGADVVTLYKDLFDVKEMIYGPLHSATMYAQLIVLKKLPSDPDTTVFVTSFFNLDNYINVNIDHTNVIAYLMFVTFYAMIDRVNTTITSAGSSAALTSQIEQYENFLPNALKTLCNHIFNHPNAIYPTTSPLDPAFAINFASMSQSSVDCPLLNYPIISITSSSSIDDVDHANGNDNALLTQNTLKFKEFFLLFFFQLFLRFKVNIATMVRNVTTDGSHTPEKKSMAKKAVQLAKRHLSQLSLLFQQAMGTNPAPRDTCRRNLIDNFIATVLDGYNNL